MRYIANTPADRAAMLEAIGLASTADLFADIPAHLRQPAIDLPAPLTEPEAARLLRALSAQNLDLTDRPCFLGAGAYRHWIPSVVGHVIGRAEFYTSYTPYQPEVSQGTLQTIYEYQSLVCLLTGMDAANASHYDGATALAEAIAMAAHITGRSRAVVAPALYPEYRQVARTYLQGRDLTIVEPPLSENGQPQPTFTPDRAAAYLDESVACLVVQQPNFFGCLEDVAGLAAAAHRVGALCIVSVYPIALGLLKPPGDLGADIVVGEGQSLGLPLSYGGPYLGLFACRERYLRQMPGRIVGQTVDVEGRRGFVLTLQAREQHIRRERATSNICTNQALCALAATVYLTALGPQGLREVARLCVQKAHYLAERVTSLPGFRLAFSAPFFNEFVVRCPVPPVALNRRLRAAGIIGGYPLGRHFPDLADGWLLCATELTTREDIERLVEALTTIVATTPARP